MRLLSDTRQLLLSNPIIPAFIVVGTVLLIAFLFIQLETHRLIGEEKLKASGKAAGSKKKKTDKKAAANRKPAKAPAGKRPSNRAAPSKTIDDGFAPFKRKP